METAQATQTTPSGAGGADAASLPRKDAPGASTLTAFDAVEVPLTPQLEEVARLDEELAKLRANQEELRKHIADEYAAASEATAVGDSKRTADHTREAARWQKSFDHMKERIEAVGEERRSAARAAGLLPIETWVYVTSEDRYYRVLSDGRTLGPGHKKEGYVQAITQAVANGRDTDTRTVEGIRAIYGTEDLFSEWQGATYFNAFRMPTVKPKRGSCKGVLKVVLNLTGGNREHAAFILGWLAAPLQSVFGTGKPLLMGTFVALVGAPGTGKDLLFAAYSALVGHTNSEMLQQDDIESRFTRPDLPDKLVVMINEVQSTSGVWNSSVANKLKLWATSPEIRDESKGRDVRMRRRAFNTILASNEDLPFRVDRGDRRYSVFKAESKLPVDAKGQVIDPDIKNLIAELAALRAFHDKGGTGAAPSTPQLSAFSHLLRRLRPHRLTKPGQIVETEAKNAIIGEFRNSLEEFVEAIKTDGLESVVATWAAMNSRREYGNPQSPFAEDELYRTVLTKERLPGGGGTVFRPSLAVVEPNRLHALYVEWSKWTGRKDRIVPAHVFKQKLNAMFDGGHKTRNLGGLAQPRVLRRVPWRTPAEKMVRERLEQCEHIDLEVERLRRQQGNHAAA